MARGTRARWEPNEREPPKLAEVGSGRAVVTTEQKHCTEVVELVSRGVVTVTGAQAMIKVTYANYNEYLPEDMDLPPSWFMAKKLGVAERDIKYFTRDFCVDCDYAFPVDKTVHKCPECKDTPSTRFGPNGKALRQAYYFDIDAKLKTIFSHIVTARAMEYGNEYKQERGPMANRVLRDVWDGSILQVGVVVGFISMCVCGVTSPPFIDPVRVQRHLDAIGAELSKACIFFGLSNDGVEVEKNVAYTPITGRVYNWPPKMRGLLRSIVLFGYLPPNVKNYRGMLQPVCDQFAKHAPLGEDAVPIKVYNAHTRRREDKWIVLAKLMNDIRAVPLCTDGSHPPCYVGGCNYCNVTGQYHVKTTLVPGSVRLLPQSTCVLYVYAMLFVPVTMHFPHYMCFIAFL